MTEELPYPQSGRSQLRRHKRRFLLPGPRLPKAARTPKPRFGLIGSNQHIRVAPKDQVVVILSIRSTRSRGGRLSRTAREAGHGGTTEPFRGFRHFREKAFNAKGVL